MALLTPWESETRLLALFVASGLLRDGHAQSVLLVSPPGQGKTAMIQRFRALPSARSITDLTSNGVRRVMSRDDNRVIRHLLMPEFARLYSRDQRVSAQAVNLLCNLMTGDAGEELIGTSEYNFDGRQIGVIGAMTTDSYRALESAMKDTGLLSRFTVLHVNRSEEERHRVIRAIARQDAMDLSLVRWPELYQPPRDVVCSSAMGTVLMDWLESTSIALDERFMARLMVLVRAAALLNGRNRVTTYDVHTLMSFTPYFESRTNVRLDWPVVIGGTDHGA